MLHKLSHAGAVFMLLAAAFFLAAAPAARSQSADPAGWTLERTLAARDDLPDQVQSRLADAPVTFSLAPADSSGQTRLALSGAGVDLLREVLFTRLADAIGFPAAETDLTIAAPLLPGQSAVLVLPVNFSTGYNWDWSRTTCAVLEIAGTAQLTDAPGSAAHLRLNVTAGEEGCPALALTYRRAWEEPAEPVLRIALALDAFPAELDLTDPAETPAAGSPLPEEEPVVEATPQDIPAAFDWRAYGVITPIRNQGNCGTCWAFASTSLMETAAVRAGLGTAATVDYSEQYLASCNNSDYSEDCDDGGWEGHPYHTDAWGRPWNAVPALINPPGAVLESAFPYTSGTTGVIAGCSAVYSHPAALLDWGFVGINYRPTITELQQAILDYGPVVANVCTGPAFQAYHGGIFGTDEKDYCAPDRINHSVVLVGWGSSGGTPYWIVRNSWGTGWGESGYMRMGYNLSNLGWRSNYVATAYAKITPAVTSLSPASAYFDTPDFTLTINGSGFGSWSTVQWDGTPLTPATITATRITVPIHTADWTDIGLMPVTVTNAYAGNHNLVSNAVNFSILGNPIPAVTGISPASAPASGPVVVVTLTGSNYLPTSVARFNGTDLPTEYVSSTTLRAWIAPALMSAAGSQPVTVFNRAPGGGDSAPVSFTVLANPVPVLAAISPESIPYESAEFRLAATGSNFVPASQILWDGSPRFTYYISPTELQAVISPDDVASQGEVEVSVSSPTPGGGISSSRSFTISAHAVPVITRFRPAYVLLNQPPASIRLEGSGFYPGTSVTVDGKPVSPVLEDAGTLRLDLPTFNSNPPVTNGTVYAMLEQPDGKIVISGDFTSVNGVYRPAIARLHPDGGLDLGFVPIPLPHYDGSPTPYKITALALQSDGKIIIGGDFRYQDDSNHQFYQTLARLNPDGSHDKAFIPPVGMSGVAGATVWSILIRPDTTVLVAGYISEHLWGLLWDGSVDASFQRMVKNCCVYSVDLQPDGKILVGGTFTEIKPEPPTYRYRIARLNYNGTLDTSFNAGSGPNDMVRSVQLLGSGDVLIGGDFTNVNGTSRTGIALLTGSGALVPDRFYAGVSTSESVHTLALQPDGSVYAGGKFSVIGGGTAANLAHLDANGSLNPAFNPGSSANDTVEAVLKDSHARVLAGGAFTIFNGAGRDHLAFLEADGSFHTPYVAGFVPVMVTNPEMGGGTASASLPVLASVDLHTIALPMVAAARSARWVEVFADDFEGRFPEENNWQLFGGAYNETTWDVRDCNPYAGRGSAWAAGSSTACGDPVPANLDAWMVAGPFDMEDCSTMEISWKNLVNLRPGEDTINLMVSPDGVNFSPLAVDSLNGPLNRWYTASANTFLYCGAPQFWVGFRFTTSSNTDTLPTGWMVDDVRIRKYVP